MTSRPHPAALAGAVAVLLIAGATAAALAPVLALAPPRAAAVAVDRTPDRHPAPVPAPAAPSIGHPADTTVYDTSALPLIDVRSVTASLPVDDDADAPMTGEVVRPLASGAPVFSAPGTPPVGYLPREHHYGGTSVPVIQGEEHWVKVLLPGRQGLPPDGNGAQLVGWLRASDLERWQSESFVEVHLAANTIDIVTAAGRERVSDRFAWGKPATPTPTGRTFIMWTTVVPEFRYTEGHPVVYLGVQSPVMAGFDGGDVAVTAFHYYRERDGATSFGCIYLDGAATDRLAQVPEGTPVIIRQ